MIRTRGFSLIDLLVTIFVIAVIIAIAMPALNRMRAESEANRLKADLNSISLALESIKLETGDYPRITIKTSKEVVESQVRGARVMSAALKDHDMLGSNFGVVEFKDHDGDIELIADRFGQPILYFPALPVRLPVTERNAYVANYEVVDVVSSGMRVGHGFVDLDNGNATMRFPSMFNVRDNVGLLGRDGRNPTRVMREALSAHTDGPNIGASTHATPKFSGSYLLWSAGPDGQFGTDDDVRHVGGSQPVVLTPGGSTVTTVQDVAIIGFDPRATLPTTGGFDLELGEHVHVPPPPYSPPVSSKMTTPRPSEPPADALIITDFGATPNDGTDDADAIQRAIEAATAAGKALVVPEGTFNVGKTLQVRSGNSFYGPGTLQFIGGGEGWNMEINGSTDIFIDGITFKGRGIFPRQRTNAITIQNCIFQDISGINSATKAAIWANAGMSNSLIQNNLFLNVQGEGVWINTFAGGTVIDNNSFDGVWQPIHVISGPQGHGHTADGGSDIKFTNNVGINLDRMGIEFQGSNAKNTIVAGNSFSQWRSYNKDGHSFGMSLMNDGVGMQVLNNTLICNPEARGYDIPVGCETGGRQTVFKGNFISGFKEGMHLVYADGSVVEGNTFVGQQDWSIWMPYSTARDCLIVGNSFDMAGDAAILVQNNAQGTKIYGNKVRLGGNASFVKGADRVIVGENDISRR